MRISWNWMTELVKVDVAPEEAAERLTMAGLEVERIDRVGDGFSGVVIAEIRSKRPHPKADKLTLCEVTDGTQTLSVVCGAPNVPEPGGRVLWAPPGARLPGGFELSQKKLRGEMSHGMICSETELGLGDDADGIMVLQGEDAEAELGVAAQDALGLRDIVMELGITANRGDCLGHFGLAREIAALTGGELMPPQTSLTDFTSSEDVNDLAKVIIDDEKGCPRYTARVITDLTLAPSPRWMRRRLEAVGVRPISNLVDIANYVMFELGQPLHAFDYAGVADHTIRVRRAQAGETMVTLDDETRTLEASDLLICDGKQPVALAGVMGGAGSAVQDATRSLLLESAYFDPMSVRTTARRLGLHSESSYRFERHVDPNGVDFASARAARLFAELGGGKVARGVIDKYAHKRVAARVTLRPERVRGLLGVDIAIDEMHKVLSAIQLPVEKKNGELYVTCPTFRPDLEREVDLIEEVGRLTGLDRIPSTLPATLQAPGAPPLTIEERVRDALCAAGLSETVSFGFTSIERTEALRFKEGHAAKGGLLELANPLRDDLRYMRTSLVPNLVAACALNIKRGVQNVRLFELGHVFLPSGKELPDEPHFVAGVVTGEASGWLKAAGELDFFDLKGIVERLFGALRMPVMFTPARDEDGFLHPGIAATIGSVDDHFYGVVGEVHPETRERLEIEQRCFAFEINLRHLPELSPAQFFPLPRFPKVTRDISFFCDDFVPARRIRFLIENSRPDHLSAVRVLDDYREPGKVPEGKKGMLWSLTYQAANRTLTDAEVDAAHEVLVRSLLGELKAERR